VRSILSSLSVVTFGRLAAAAIGLTTQVYLARALSPAALGTFFLATSLAAFLAILSTVGLPMVTARFLVRYRSRARGELGAVFVATTRRLVLTTALTVMAVGIVAVLAWPGLPAGERTALAIGCLAVPSFAVIQLAGSAAAAYRRFQLSYLPDLVGRPVAFLVLVVALGLLTPRLDLSLTLAIFVAVAAAVAVYQDSALRRDLGAAPLGARHRRRLAGLWLRAAAPLTGVVLATVIFADIAILAAGAWLEPADLAVYGVCVKIALIVGFAQTTAYKMFQPDLAEALIAGDRRRLSVTVGQANLIGIGVGVAAFAAVAVSGDLVLSVFGDSFAAGRSVLLVLLAGQILVAAGGPAIQVLTLTRGQAAAAWSSLVAVLCLAASSAVLVPPFGVQGAAVALVCTEVLWAALLALQARRTSGVACDVFAPISLARRGLPVSVTP
jgi:O-antigen/teichoic acid export membrane protein